MRALVLTEVGQPQELVDDLVLDQPRDHEVLVRTKACGVCHSDLHFRQGTWTTFPLPLVLGHECAGIVEAVGSQVTYLRPGDAVVGCLTAFCGECSYCLSGRMYLCAQGGLSRDSGAPRLSRNGQPVSQFVNLSGFSEMMLVHERALVKVDPDIPLDVAAIVGCAVTTGVGAAVNTAKVRPGETVVVVGCGGVGLNVVQGARIAGAGRIIAVDRSPTKAEAARTFGATDVVVADGTEVDQVLELTSGGVEHAFEAVGRRVTAEAAFRMLTVGGTATIVGLLPEGEQISVSGVDLTFGRTLQGSNMGSNRFRVDIPRYLQMYRDGRLLLDELITARISLEEADDALVALEAGDGITRSVVVFD
ncbi:Zn-dependent alcohol dehydrogenase [Microbacterium sp. NPDC055910]|uniref:Zn-dependent alcohol dehydrogenase n=1 Tax=Microbacterium sp. NPDC055910 TaxID=3345659 RepID=UPI0035D9A33E